MEDNKKDIQDPEKREKAYKVLGNMVMAVFAVVIILLWIIVGFKCALLAFSILSLLMYVNVATTTLGNAFIGRSIDMNYDIIWKLLFIMCSGIGFAVYFSI